MVRWWFIKFKDCPREIAFSTENGDWRGYLKDWSDVEWLRAWD